VSRHQRPIGHKRAQTLPDAPTALRRAMHAAAETRRFAGFSRMEPANLKSNRSARLPGGRMALDDAG
jgi:hypothetical protein